MRTQLRDYGFHFNKIPIYFDSKIAIAITTNPVQHTKTKHIDAMYHFIKDNVEKGTIELYFVKSDYQLADLFTKLLDEKRFNFLVSKLDSKFARVHQFAFQAQFYKNDIMMSLGTETRPPVLVDENEFTQWQDRFHNFIERQKNEDDIMKILTE
ncbi:hypothetical protein L6452_07266 [Arctium lappa]|uniref:Uncharacterized protein n=1 Tax=Arctium lappa TaxID=4217 RepID=A0ACB9EKS3_ARCLA|nr:hypothetical protein L6452_07266 [Arctium lappa]